MQKSAYNMNGYLKKYLECEHPCHFQLDQEVASLLVLQELTAHKPYIFLRVTALLTCI